ncbi:(2Fe-2S)-binding protein [Thauera sp. JM12B12]|uniref:(2Fe-2S)-binding protein n=1 Tax=Thauera sp. JM12B12 TaxID=3142262 RepID=UPI0031F43E9A
MYVCVCNAVTERQIRKAMDEGVRTLRELRQTLGVAADCGRCARCAHDCLRTDAHKARSAGLALRPADMLPTYPLALEAT